MTKAFPVEHVNPEREGQLDSWRPGSCASVQPDNEDEGSEADVAERVRGRARGGQQRTPSLGVDL